MPRIVSLPHTTRAKGSPPTLDGARSPFASSSPRSRATTPAGRRSGGVGSRAPLTASGIAMHASASAHERLSMERSALPTYAESFAKVGFRGGRVSAVSGGEDSRGLRAHPRVHRDEHTAVARQTMPLRREWREQEPLDAAPAKTSTSEEKYPYEYPDFQGYEEPRPPNYGGRARHRDLEGPRAQRRREAVAASPRLPSLLLLQREG